MRKRTYLARVVFASAEETGRTKPRSSWHTIKLAIGVATGLLLVILATAYLTAGVVRTDRGLADGNQALEVKDLIRRVRDELAAAEADMRARNELALFKLRDFEMEINFVVRSGAGAKAEVVGIGTDLNISKEKVQKLTLRWVACPEQRTTVVRNTSVIDGVPDVVIGSSKTIAAPENTASVVATTKGADDESCRR